MQNSEYNQFLHDIAQARMSNKLKEYYFKVASLCRFKKNTPIVQNLDIGTAEVPKILHDDKEIEQHLSGQIKKEFGDGKDHKV